MGKIFGKMDLNWVMEHKNKQLTQKKTQGKPVNAYHTRQKHTKRDQVSTFALQDDAGVTKVIVDVPDGAEVFQRHRCNIPINYFNRFHEYTETTPETFDPGSRQVISAKTIKRNLGEITYGEVWLIGWRKREGTQITVYYKALYPDGKVDEHHAWLEKPWLYEPEWFTEEQV